MKKKKIYAAYGNIQSVSGYKKVNFRCAHDVLVAGYVAEISAAEQSRLKLHENAYTSLLILHLAG